MEFLDPKQDVALILVFFLSLYILYMSNAM